VAVGTLTGGWLVDAAGDWGFVALAVHHKHDRTVFLVPRAWVQTHGNRQRTCWHVRSSQLLDAFAGNYKLDGASSTRLALAA
jgi:hypothetical protein